MDESLRVVLEAGNSDAEVTVRVSHSRDALLSDRDAVQLNGSRVEEFSAASTFEVLSTSLATYGPIAKGLVVGVAAARALPKEAWDAFAQALTIWSSRHADARIEYEYGDGRRLIVENDPRAVRRALDEAVLPHVREQQVARHDQWGRLLDGTANVGDAASDDPG